MKKENLLVLAVLFLILFSACKNGHKLKIDEDNTILGGAEPTVRVRIINTVDTVRVVFINERVENVTGDTATTGTEYEVYCTGNSLVFSSGAERKETDSLVFSSINVNDEVEIKGVPYGIGWWWEGKETRRYSGDLKVYPGENNKPEFIVSLSLEQYLTGVVPYEIGGDSPLEAIKAQAVAARSEAVMALKSGMYGGKYHDLTSDVECQVFSGNLKRTDVSDKAVYSTTGIILTSEGEPINAYYASNCGGHSELIKNVWPDRPDPEPYRHAVTDQPLAARLDLRSEEKVRMWIESTPDVYCNPGNGTELPGWTRKNFRWRRSFAINELPGMIVPDVADAGRFTGIKINKRGLSGRIYDAVINFENANIDTKSELELRQKFNPPLRSSCFIYDIENDSLVIKGAGWGHGVGMCQSGAVARALQGSSFKDILLHYYQKAKLKKLY